jgi:hypothetical protein
MKFNVVLCYLKLGDTENAKKILTKINVDQGEAFFKDWVSFKRSVIDETFDYAKV